MLIKFFLLTYIFFSIFFSTTFARPISYAGGWTAMQKNDFNRHSFQLHFSPSANHSLGYRAEYWRNDEWQFHGFQINNLIKRINKPKSQANFYFKNGLGINFSDYENFEKKTDPAVFSGVAMDWEDRRFFTSYENRLHYSPNIEKFYIQEVKVGIAPYLGKYGDFHTWLMFKVEHMPNSNRKFVYSPFLRMFKGDFLGEIGLSDFGDIMLNVVKRF